MAHHAEAKEHRSVYVYFFSSYEYPFLTSDLTDLWLALADNLHMTVLKVAHEKRSRKSQTQGYRYTIRQSPTPICMVG